MALQYMTQEGLDKLKKELAEAIAQRPVISAAIAEARDKGDLSENAEYEAAREAQGLLELNIAKLQNLVANARVIDESQIGTDKVQMLNKVKVKNLNTNQIMNFTLVSEQEADFMAGKLAVKTLNEFRNNKPESNEDNQYYESVNPIEEYIGEFWYIQEVTRHLQ